MSTPKKSTNYNHDQNSNLEELKEEEKTQKCLNYISWDEYFMSIAFLAAKRSKDPITKVGACIVDKSNRILSVGYNGFPRNCDDDKFSWSKSTSDPLQNKHMYVVHAEANAILNKNCVSLDGSRMYVALFPCNECAKLIIQSGVQEIVYMSDKHDYKNHTIAAKRMFDAANIKYHKFTPRQNQICIDFTEIDWEKQNQLPSTPVKTMNN